MLIMTILTWPLVATSHVSGPQFPLLTSYVTRSPRRNARTALKITSLRNIPKTSSTYSISAKRQSEKWSLFSPQPKSEIKLSLTNMTNLKQPKNPLLQFSIAMILPLLMLPRGSELSLSLTFLFSSQRQNSPLPLKSMELLTITSSEPRKVQTFNRPISSLKTLKQSKDLPPLVNGVFGPKGIA